MEVVIAETRKTRTLGELTSGVVFSRNNLPETYVVLAGVRTDGSLANAGSDTSAPSRTSERAANAAHELGHNATCVPCLLVETNDVVFFHVSLTVTPTGRATSVRVEPFGYEKES